MWKRKLAGLEFSVEHRRRGHDGGPSLAVRDVRRAGRELLRFDCFERNPHFHVDPDGRDEITQLDPLADSVAWCTAELGRNLPRYLEKAGLSAADAGPLEAEPLRALLRESERAMRNPPAQLDDLDIERLKARVSEKWATYPSDVLPAWVAEMDFPLAEPIRLTLQRAVDRDDAGYPVDLHQTGLREAFAEYMHERFAWTIDPNRCEVVTDVVQGMYVALGAYSEAGDGVIVQTPIYPPFLEAVAEMGRRLDENRLVQGERGHEIDFDALRASLDARTRVLMLCNPHNPTGRVFTRAELNALAEIVLEHDLVVVTDEIHADLVYAGGQHIPFATLGPELEARTLTLNSATKAFNIPGLRCSLAHFGSASLQERFLAYQPRHVRGGIGLLGIEATLAAWRHSQPWLAQVLAYLDANRAFLADFVADHFPGVIHHSPEATYLAWLDCRALALPENPGRFFLKNERLALSDGRHFGAGFEGHLRLNFATSRAILRQVLERMAAALKRAGVTN
ncbi:MAG: MalY/PatB family protein [Myxococcota bacterium]